MNQFTLQKVEELVTPIIEELGYKLVRLAVENAGVDDTRKVLVVYINKAGGVNMDDVVKVTKQISPTLDEADIIKGSYILSVSSPGESRQS